MNPFETLIEEKTDDEITSVNQYRNLKKKKEKKEKQFQKNPTKSLKSEIYKLNIQINEYNHKISPSSKKGRKRINKKKSKKVEDDNFLNEKEIRKYNQARQKEIDIKREKELKKNDRKKQEEENRKKQEEENRKKQEEENRKKQRNVYTSKHNTLQYILKSIQSGIVPPDIVNLYNNFTISKWKLLMLKYHPDKVGENNELAYLLNNIKDYYIN